MYKYVGSNFSMISIKLYVSFAPATLTAKITTANCRQI